jgi:hypothetical protein
VELKVSLNLKRRDKSKRRIGEAGAALLIAIFALLLISVVAIALVVTSMTDSSLQSNYRTSTESYYAALAGLEEARGRLLWKNPDYINITNSYPTLMSPGGLPTFGLTQVFYIVNPASGETVDPQSVNPANYPDTEYQTEFGWPLSGTVVTEIPSVSVVAGLPGPLYKWVRITPATEKSLNIDVDGNGIQDSATSLLYDPANADNLNPIKPSPGLIVPAPPATIPATAVQALEITALAVLPTGSRRLLQYVVAPLVISSAPSLGAAGNTFPGALTLDGNNVTFQDPGGAPNYKIDGRDGCSATIPQGAVESIGYTNSADHAAIYAQAVPNKNNYPGYPMIPTGPPPPTYIPTTPSIPNPPSTLRPSWENPATLDGVVQDITNSADVVINASANGADISSRAPTMSAANPMTIVINGDLDLGGWHNTGYGLLLVTGTLHYDPDASWNGLVLVIGQGIISSSKNGTGGIQGAVVVAKTRDTSGNLLTTTTLGSPFFGTQSSYGSNPGFGIIYSSCLAQTAQGPLSYKVLSFREIPLTN